MQKETATPNGSSRKRSGAHGNFLAAQRHAHREVSPGLTTIELREQYDEMMPAARVHELRWMFDFHIVRTWVHYTNPQGNRHNIARYPLLPGKWQEVA